ncbi:MAG: thioredoxin domain-containing protein [Salinisphaera sp.]|jgi:protein-disulfide isomerase|nr:thioredoxin domain-containing protein [Salinisphaera sp.]
MTPQNENARSSLFGAVFFPVLIIGALIIVAILVMSYRGNQRTAPKPGDGPTQLDASTMNALRNKYDKLGESIGQADAPVTVREFGDYQCPACGHFAPTAERMRKAYVKTGKVRFIFFDFPLPMHQHAQAAAVAARCAGRQNKFWPYHDRLYATQSKWAEENDPSSTFLDIAVETGVDSGQLKQCMASDEPLATINAERDAGKAVKLRATPTVLVGNTEFVGGPSYDKLKKAIDDALQAADNGAKPQ